MKLRLFEIELNTNDLEASKHFYSEQLGLETFVDIEGLKVLGTGINDLDLNKSKHFPGKISISFLLKIIKSASMSLVPRVSAYLRGMAILSRPLHCKIQMDVELRSRNSTGNYNHNTYSLTNHLSGQKGRSSVRFLALICSHFSSMVLLFAAWFHR